MCSKPDRWRPVDSKADSTAEAGWALVGGARRPAAAATSGGGGGGSGGQATHLRLLLPASAVHSSRGKSSQGQSKQSIGGGAGAAAAAAEARARASRQESPRSCILKHTMLQDTPRQEMRGWRRPRRRVRLCHPLPPALAQHQPHQHAWAYCTLHINEQVTEC